jgi:TM2 domain-containing membrane protein YozV
MSKETFPIRWRGKTSGPHDIDALRNMLEKGDVSLMHEISLDGRWISLEEFLAQRPKRAPAPVVVVQKPVQPPEPPPRPPGPPPIPPEELFYVAKGGQKQGPHTKSTLQQLIHAGVLSSDDLAWKEGIPDWTPLARLVDFPALGAASNPFSAVRQPPPPAVTQMPVPPSSAPSQPATSKSRVAYILLGLFLGGLGIHNFYAGYGGKGLIQLLLTLLTGWLVIPLLVVLIWVIVEVCTVTQDADGHPFT